MDLLLSPFNILPRFCGRLLNTNYRYTASKPNIIRMHAYTAEDINDNKCSERYSTSLLKDTNHDTNRNACSKIARVVIKMKN